MKMGGFNMIKKTVWLLCLLLCACGQSPVAETKSVTNGKLVLGIVPLAGGVSEKNQRYRLLVCKRLAHYTAKDFADHSVCRSALLTKDGVEVDLVGNKLDAAHQDIGSLDIAGLESEFAPVARLVEQSPIGENHKRVSRHALPASFFVGLYSALIGVFFTFVNFTGDMPALGKTGIVMIVSGIFVSVVAAVAATVSKNKAAIELDKRRKSIGDSAGRNIPAPVAKYVYSLYSRTDQITNQHWQSIFTKFNDKTSLEYESDLRAILAAIARFYKLNVNENALAL